MADDDASSSQQSAMRSESALEPSATAAAPSPAAASTATPLPVVAVARDISSSLVAPSTSAAAVPARPAPSFFLRPLGAIHAAQQQQQQQQQHQQHAASSAAWSNARNLSDDDEDSSPLGSGHGSGLFSSASSSSSSSSDEEDELSRSRRSDSSGEGVIVSAPVGSAWDFRTMRNSYAAAAAAGSSDDADTDIEHPAAAGSVPFSAGRAAQSVPHYLSGMRVGGGWPGVASAGAAASLPLTAENLRNHTRATNNHGRTRYTESDYADADRDVVDAHFHNDNAAAADDDDDDDAALAGELCGSDCEECCSCRSSSSSSALSVCSCTCSLGAACLCCNEVALTEYHRMEDALYLAENESFDALVSFGHTHSFASQQVAFILAGMIGPWVWNGIVGTLGIPWHITRQPTLIKPVEPQQL